MTNIAAGNESSSPSPASPISGPSVKNAADSDKQIAPKESVRDAGAASPDTFSAEGLPDVAGMTLVSSTVHTQEDEPTPTYPARPTDVPERVSPEVESLKAMFPDFDITIIQSVLASVGGDQERATDVLLGMSDPSYVSQQQSAPSQTELDEQLARHLMYEDQQQQAEWHPDQHHPFGRQDRVDGLSYQPRGQGGPYQNGGQWGSGPQGGSGRDTMAEVQEQFSKIAETGKKTFSSLVTKVRAKMQEFDQSRNSSGSSSQSSWGSGTPSGAPPGSRSQAYYAPSGPPPPQGQSYTPAGTQGYESGRGDYGQQQQGYDAAPQTQAVPTPAAGTASGFSAANTTTTPPPAERIPPRPTSAGPPPAGNVDPTKIGMLPKRPVSLMGSTPPNAVHKDDDDELDYVENPFEEQGK